MAEEVTERSVSLLNVYLGLKPYVLLELDGESTGPGEDDWVLKIDMTYGGGIGGKNGAFSAMRVLLEENGFTVTPPDGFDPDADDPAEEEEATDG